MANTVKSTFDKVGDVIEEIFGTNRSAHVDRGINNKAGRTCLEKIGMESRHEMLSKNEWKKDDIEYTRGLVLAEYVVQDEFKVSSTDEPVIRNRSGFETITEQSVRRSNTSNKKNK